jgi:RHS repeat-associated protein
LYYESFDYDKNGNKVYVDKNGEVTRYKYDGMNRLTRAWNDNAYTYTRGTELIGYTSNSGDRLYYVQDGHGNVTALLNEDGTEKKTYSYNPYGKEEEQILYPMGSKTAIMLWRLQVETHHNPFRYCGEYYDDETDLVYLRNRYYNNQTGRFITEDPIKDGLNWYSYCGNNPINYIDPTGLYDRDEAVKYAVKWHDGTNSPTYERFDTVGAFISSLGRTRGDCANFVSQSLVAGGLTMNSSWHYYSKTTDEWHGNSVIQKMERDMTSAWASAKGQYEFFSSDWAGYKNGEVIQIWSKKGMEYNIKYNNIQKGDLMFFAHRDTGEVYHATIISQVTEDEIKYAAHTSNRKYEKLSDHLDSDFVVIVRIRDDAIRGYVK